jgi:hypothetical protein
METRLRVPNHYRLIFHINRSLRLNCINVNYGNTDFIRQDLEKLEGLLVRDIALLKKLRSSLEIK